jgi:hypothetical protein
MNLSIYWIHLQTLIAILSPFSTLRGVPKGMNKGNQLNIPGEWEWGAIDIITSLYKTLSKVPENPWIVAVSDASKLMLPYLMMMMMMMFTFKSYNYKFETVNCCVFTLQQVWKLRKSKKVIMKGVRKYVLSICICKTYKPILRLARVSIRIWIWQI